MMITQNVDEAINMSEQIVLLIDGPAAIIGKILEVPSPYPRDQPTMRNSGKY